MTRAIPKEEREKIVQAYENGLGTIAELAAIFSISSKSVQKYLRQYRETGDLTPYTQPGRPPILTEDKLEIIKEIVISNPDGRLQDHRDDLYQQTGTDVTIVTIHNACKALDLRRKKRVFSHLNKNVKMYK